ncbi:sphingoid long-chain bases kinase 1 [Forsythia ovata]|uniref:Sphingoid long-chain bases kinase 1 n=1 Tax=Forsythia ovata TaxID=205694 RepID=A0ABD1U985_9LAMI
MHIPVKKVMWPFYETWEKFERDSFVASTSEDALQWVNAFAYQQCYVNCLPHPMASKKHGSDSIVNEFPPESIRCKSPSKMLVILNPRSGRGRSSKVFGLVEPIFKILLRWFLDVKKSVVPKSCSA